MISAQLALPIIEEHARKVVALGAIRPLQVFIVKWMPISWDDRDAQDVELESERRVCLSVCWRSLCPAMTINKHTAVASLPIAGVI